MISERPPFRSVSSFQSGKSNHLRVSLLPLPYSCLSRKCPETPGCDQVTKNFKATLVTFTSKMWPLRFFLELSQVSPRVFPLFKLSSFRVILIQEETTEPIEYPSISCLPCTFLEQYSRQNISRGVTPSTHNFTIWSGISSLYFGLKIRSRSLSLALDSSFPSSLRHSDPRFSDSLLEQPGKVSLLCAAHGSNHGPRADRSPMLLKAELCLISKTSVHTRTY